jgi:hypothetical protein
MSSPLAAECQSQNAEYRILNTECRMPNFEYQRPHPRTSQDYDSSYKMVRDKRHVCRPNVGFMCQLISWRQRCCEPCPPDARRLYRIASHHPRDRLRVVAKWVDQVCVPLFFNYQIPRKNKIVLFIGGLQQPGFARRVRAADRRRCLSARGARLSGAPAVRGHRVAPHPPPAAARARLEDGACGV